MKQPSFLTNSLKVLQQPQLGLSYLEYQISRWRHGGHAILKHRDVELRGFTGFSEYHTTQQVIEDNEYRFLVNSRFSSGPMIDVGANLGLVSLLLARHHSGRQIFAFEPNPSTHAACEVNLQRNEADNITLERYAVGDTNGKVHFDTSPHSRATAHIAADQTGVEVPCTTLDEYAAQNGIESVALLKVDVEGYEEAVFAGAQDLLPHIAVVYFEVCPANARSAGLDPRQPAQQLLDAGFELFRIAHDGDLIPAALEDIERVRLEN